MGLRSVQKYLLRRSNPPCPLPVFSRMSTFRFGVSFLMSPSQVHVLMSIYSYNLPGSAHQAVPRHSVIIELIARVVWKTGMSW